MEILGAHILLAKSRLEGDDEPKSKMLPLLQLCASWIDKAGWLASPLPEASV